MLNLPKYSFGVGDRFGREGRAQLRALVMAAEEGVQIAPVWNKSHREHTIIGTEPGSVRKEADQAVQSLGWSGPYFVDADHIGLKNVDLFMEASDFFTLDAADFIGQAADEDDVRAFVDSHSRYAGSALPGTDFDVTAEKIEEIARKYLAAVREAGRIYRRIESAKGAGNFVSEVSMDETDSPQTPEEMFFILAAVAKEGIPAQTIAPRFSGRFNKGVDYVGDVSAFAGEFEANVAVISTAVKEFGLPSNLKLSVHSGSDKFAIYGCIRDALRKFDCGVHVKTAGTTWLEELIGLALAGGDGLGLVKEIYISALDRYEELCGPYRTVIDIDRAALSSPGDVSQWRPEEFASALRHDSKCGAYNRSIRQMLHVAYKVAAEMGDRFLRALDDHADIISENVTTNLYDRHIRPIFSLEKPGTPY